MMPQDGLEQRKGMLIFLIALVLGAAFSIGAFAGYFAAHGEGRVVFAVSRFSCRSLPLGAYLLYRKMIFPSYRRLEDANLELHLKQEELLDIKDDLFIKFLGVYDANFAANSPRLFADRLTDVADITARVMGADACLVYLYDRKKDDLVLSATNGVQEAAIGTVRIPLGEGTEGWVGRRLEPLMLKDFRADARYRETPGLALDDYQSVYCLPLYVYSNGALVGVMEVFFRKAKEFTDEEINFFTTLTGMLFDHDPERTDAGRIAEDEPGAGAVGHRKNRGAAGIGRAIPDAGGKRLRIDLPAHRNGDIVFANEQARTACRTCQV